MVSPYTKPCIYIPSPLHADAYTHAKTLGFDLLLPDDVRVEHWEEHADCICLRQGKIHGDLVKASKRLKIMARNGTGYDMIPIDLCKKLGIAVTSLPGFNAEAVAEHTLAMTLSLSRRVAETDRKMRAGQALRSVDFMARSLSGRTIGLVGMGSIAREVAMKFRAFNCEILVYSPTSPTSRWTSNDPLGSIPHQRCHTLQELLPLSDYVSLNCPVTPDTLSMINSDTLSLMRRTSILLNLGRGELVDEQALLSALTTGQIAGACLDVFCEEPATTAVYGDLFKLDNVVITPHIAATTEEITRESTIRAVQNCWDFLHGREDLIDHRVC